MPSSDLFNMNSDLAIKGLMATLKSVDDFLTSARNWVELRERMRALFQASANLILK